MAKKLRIDLNTDELIGSREASLMWGKQKDYVRTIYNKYPKRFPEGTIRKFGKQLIVTKEGMEIVTGTKLENVKAKK
ncbi:helix-turn-helix domain-containing protein [Pediococcus argentinicus]|uniref:helix-turn-helix domain-containing protein n=1 Tax=Pediococcus argentinicus TaxID=480391 RepID=UPI00338E4F85